MPVFRQRQHARPGPVAAGFAFATLVTLMAFSAAPTPLYRRYSVDMDLSAFDITLVFAAYVISFLAALLLFGRQSDYHGRRPVLFAALAGTLLALGCFFAATGFEILLLARVLQGISAGMAVPALGAYIMENDARRGLTYNGVANFLGMGIGIVIAGLLTNFAPMPLGLTYIVLAGLVTFEILTLTLMPETVDRKRGALAALVPSIRVPHAAVTTLLTVTPLNIAGWALGGFCLSVLPAVVARTAGSDSPMINIAVLLALMGVAAVSIMVTRNRPPQRVMNAGAVSIAVGVGLVLAGMHLGSVAVLGVGIMIAGIGFGANFSAILRAVLPLSRPEERAGLLTAFWIESYLALSLPVITVGFMITAIGLEAATDIYGVAILVMTTLSAIALRLVSKSERTACPATGSPNQCPNSAS